MPTPNTGTYRYLLRQVEAIETANTEYNRRDVDCHAQQQQQQQQPLPVGGCQRRWWWWLERCRDVSCCTSWMTPQRILQIRVLPTTRTAGWHAPQPLYRWTMRHPDWSKVVHSDNHDHNHNADEGRQRRWIAASPLAAVVVRTHESSTTTTTTAGGRIGSGDPVLERRGARCVQGDPCPPSERASPKSALGIASRVPSSKPPRRRRREEPKLCHHHRWRSPRNETRIPPHTPAA
jgi:hypothetical protein